MAPSTRRVGAHPASGDGDGRSPDRRQPRPLTPAEGAAFCDRELEVPIATYAIFKLFGAPAHRQRLILLDVIVRKFVSMPPLEVFEDQSVRYATNVAPKMIFVEAKEVRDLRTHLRYDHNVPWLYLLSPICEYCHRAWNHHSPPGGKCLFEATRWQELHIPDPGNSWRFNEY